MAAFSSLLRRALRPALLVALFLAVLLGLGWAVRRRLPFPPVPAVEPKVAWLHAHGDEYDTLFVGSSRTYRHLIPEVFDRLMAEAGTPTKSFNFGFDGMRPPEDSYVMEAVLAARKTPVKYVLVEANALRMNLDAHAQGTVRAAYWHDAKRTAAIARSTLWMKSYDETTLFGIWSDRFSGISVFLEHLQPVLSRAVNVGRGYEGLPTFGGAHPQEKLSDAELGARHDGYHVDDEPRPIRDTPLAKLRKGVSERLKKPGVPYFADVESQNVLREKRRVIEAHGGQMIIFQPPKVEPEKFYPDPKIAGDIPMIDLSDPKAFPELYDPQYRKDDAHLNPVGAEIYTRMIVERLQPLLKR